MIFHKYFQEICVDKVYTWPYILLSAITKFGLNVIFKACKYLFFLAVEIIFRLTNMFDKTQNTSIKISACIKHLLVL